MPSIRFDFPELHIPQDLYVSINKKLSACWKTAESKAKPEACVLCGEKRRSFCNSHTIPQFSLREIALDGELYTINHAIAMDPASEKKGIRQAGTFKSVCCDCDQKYFADYENPDVLGQASSPSQLMLGKIAVKICLLERYKALVQVEALREASNVASLLTRPNDLPDVRKRDYQEDDKLLDYAMNVTEGLCEGYRLLFDVLLSYTVPIAFQGQIALVSDFAGNRINDVFNYSNNYRIEPLYICIFPLRGASRILVFCRSVGFARYKKFGRRIKTLTQKQALKVLLKLVLAYSEELYLSPLLPESVFLDSGFASLARMGGMRFYFEAESEKQRWKEARKEFAIDALPEPPDLFGLKYSMDKLSEGQPN